MRTINLKSGCSVPASECERKRICKDTEICDAHAAYCPLYYDKSTGTVNWKARNEHCESGCTQKFYICPNLILEGE